MDKKRKYPRTSVYVLASFDCYNEDGELVAQKLGIILDVSMGGVLIESDDIIEASYVEIVFVNHENKVLTTVGSVIHSRKAENGKVKTGLCFHGSDTENIKIVTNLIRTNYYGKKNSQHGNL